jgi:hypothetical protein
MNTASQEARILKYLEAGHTLTPLDALEKFGCFRLGARIFGLKRRGHFIETEIVERNGKRVAMYFMPEKKKAGREKPISAFSCEQQLLPYQQQQFRSF